MTEYDNAMAEEQYLEELKESLDKMTLRQMQELFWELVIDSEGLITPSIELIQDKILSKKEATLDYIISNNVDMQSLIDGKKQHKKDLDAAIKTLEKKLEQNKEWAKHILGTMEKTKYSSSYGSLSTRTSKEVVIVDEDRLGYQFINQKITESPDKIKIKKAIESGLEVPGAIIKTNINIKTKG